MEIKIVIPFIHVLINLISLTKMIFRCCPRDGKMNSAEAERANIWVSHKVSLADEIDFRAMTSRLDSDSSAVVFKLDFRYRSFLMDLFGNEVSWLLISPQYSFDIIILSKETFYIEDNSNSFEVNLPH